MSTQSFGPRKQDFQDILITSLGALLAGMIGSVVIVLFSFLLSGYFDITGNFTNVQYGGEKSASFPIILSFITLIGTSISSFLSYVILNMTDPEKYKKNIVIFGQIALYQVFIFVFIVPIYIYTGVINYNNILVVYIIHILVLSLGINIILEVLNNYRYILIGIYGSFLGFFMSSIITVFIFIAMDSSYAKLISLIILLPLVNFLSVFFKQVFEYLYYFYYKMTGLDQIGDIFFQIELEEKEKLKELEQKNTI